jgi:3-hydroxyisobutyrate dehydrogenase-like beta-hydroxyacid dehydrogenase
VNQNVTFVGLGAMGEPMAANLLKHGVAVTVVKHRRPEPVERLRALGAYVASSLAEAAPRSDTFILMLPSSASVEATVRGPDGILARARRDALVVDCSTSDPASSRALAALLGERDVGFVDAPVTRGVQGAKQGKLAFFIGGPRESVARARELLAHMGDTFFEMGGVGSGHATKIINQVLSYATVALVSEALQLGASDDLDLDRLFDALMAGSGSKALESFGKRIIERQFDSPRVKLGDACAHMAIAASMASRANAACFVTDAATDVYRLVANQGDAGRDIAALGELWATKSRA